MTPLTTEELAALEAAHAKATGGAWKMWGMDVMADRDGTSNIETAGLVAKTHDQDRGLRTFNGDFICEAHRLIPRLLAEVRALRQVVTSMLAANEEERNELRDVLGKPRDD